MSTTINENDGLTNISSTASTFQTELNGIDPVLYANAIQKDGNNTKMEDILLEFHTDDLPFPLSDKKFGILTIKSNKCDPITVPILIQCTIDISDSMNGLNEYRDWDLHAKKKIDYIKETLKKLLPYLIENFNMEIWIQIGLFNTMYSTLIPLQILKNSNISFLLEKIDSIRCCGCTNIEAALIGAASIMKSYIENKPEGKALHIFLTDGNPTDGSNSAYYLKKLVSSEYPTLFIGYGEDHNAHLLKDCANNMIHSYQYVNNFEITGQVYAEMLYNLIYTLEEKPTIVVEGGKIYDALNDTWISRLEIPAFISEKEYIFHISSSNTDDTLINIYDKENNLIGYTTTLPQLICDDDIYSTTNLDKYIFKQKTMELLSSILKINDSDNIDRSDIIKTIKQELSDFYLVLRKYIREKNLLDDPFMKILCEDLHISYKTINTEYAEMNIFSRRNAQATQALYRSGTSNRYRSETDFTTNTNIQRRTSYIDDDEETQLDNDENEETQLDDYSISKYRSDDSIENYNDEFVTQNIYSPTGMENMGRSISS